MRIQSPVGEYEYRVTGVRLDRTSGHIQVSGALGQWETTMVIEPSDWAAWGRRAAPALAGIAALALARRILRG